MLFASKKFENLWNLVWAHPSLKFVNMDSMASSAARVAGDKLTFDYVCEELRRGIVQNGNLNAYQRERAAHTKLACLYSNIAEQSVSIVWWIGFGQGGIARRPASCNLQLHTM